MNPPRLISVSGTAVGSFVEPFELQLPETGLVLLRGENLDTRGSSASGKSTLIHAINVPLGTCPVPLTELQSWYTKDSPRFTNTYDVDGKIVKISRGKKFELTIDGVPFRGSADQKEEKIDQLFGIGAEMRRALTYRGQREPGLFLSKKDSKKKEFLTKLLDLEKWEEECKKAAVKVKVLEDQVTMATARLTDARARLDTLREMGNGADVEAELARVVKAIAEHEAAQVKYETAVRGMRSDAEIVADLAIGLFKDEFESAEENLQFLERMVFEKSPPSPELLRLTALAADIQQRVKRLDDEDNQKIQDLLKEAQDLRNEWQRLALQASGANRLLADRDRVAADVQALKKNVCPTCQREWDEVAQKLEDLTVELHQINGELEELRDIQEEANRLKAEFDALPGGIEVNPMIDKLEQALKKVVKDMAAEEAKADEAIGEAVNIHHQAIRTARQKKDDLHARARAAANEQRQKVLAGIDGLETLAREEKEKRVKLDYLRIQLAQQVGAARERRRQVVEIEKTVDGLLAELGPLQVALAAEKDFNHLTGREAFRGLVFDEALEAISDETNAMLASISNTRNTTLKFESENETQDGKLYYEIVPVLTINGHEKGRPSGGMLSAIELAVDLAVGKVISERTGVCPGWLILDESFDGLGPTEKETCLEILNRYANDRLIIVVDHASETQGLFTQRITVQAENGVSTLAA